MTASYIDATRPGTTWAQVNHGGYVEPGLQEQLIPENVREAVDLIVHDLADRTV